MYAYLAEYTGVVVIIGAYIAYVYSVLGIIIGSLVHTLFVACGLSLILVKSVFLFNTIKMIVIIYLVYLGISVILDKSDPSFQAVTDTLNIRKI